jgi:hypothetical protein
MTAATATTRRCVLLAGAAVLSGVGAAGLRSRPAGAAFAQQKMSPEVEKLYLAGCSVADGPNHQRIVEETRTRLAGTATEDEIRAVLARLTCPICGCPVLPPA